MKMNLNGLEQKYPGNKNLFKKKERQMHQKLKSDETETRVEWK